MALMPSVSFETVMNFTWRELKEWHEVAIETYKTTHGIP
jgi:hypothetical protein